MSGIAVVAGRKVEHQCDGFDDIRGGRPRPWNVGYVCVFAGPDPNRTHADGICARDVLGGMVADEDGTTGVDAEALESCKEWRGLRFSSVASKRIRDDDGVEEIVKCQGLQLPQLDADVAIGNDRDRHVASELHQCVTRTGYALQRGRAVCTEGIHERQYINWLDPDACQRAVDDPTARRPLSR